MPKNIPHAAERLAINHLFMDLARAFQGTKQDKHRPTPTSSDRVFVVSAIAIGTYEKRPMSASDISHYIGMPRATVQRKLKLLIAADIVVKQGDRYCLSDAHLRQNPTRFLSDARKAIATAVTRTKKQA